MVPELNDRLVFYLMYVCELDESETSGVQNIGYQKTSSEKDTLI
jgi:hypothetical protein